MMIENVPDSIKPLLNNFIVMGKRCFSQKWRHVDLINDLIVSLHNNILDKMTQYKSKYFYIEVTENPSCTYHDIWIIRHIENDKNTFIRYRLYFLKSLETNSFSNAFSSIKNQLNWLTKDWYRREKSGKAILVKGEPKERIEEYIEDLESLIQTLKKALAFDFFKLVKLRNSSNLYERAYVNKQRRMYATYNEIEKLWDRETLKIGSKVKYWNKSHDKREGTVTQRYTSYSGADTIEILSPKGRKITRGTSYCEWEGKFKTTKLSHMMTDLLIAGKVPEEWSEKKLEFYS